MESWLQTPAAVRQARETQKGLHIALEILVFLAVFLACVMGEMLVTLPVQMLMLMQNQAYQEALLSQDVKRIEEAGLAAVSTDATTILSLFATAVMILLVLLFCRLLQKRKAVSLGFIRQGCGIAYIKGIGAGLLMFSGAVLICVLTGSVTLSYTPQRFSLPVFLLFASGYMIQGMAEEALCRGYFMVSLGRRYPMSVAVIVNAAAFAALHLLNPGIAPLAIVNLILFGIFASICFIQTENIWLVGALHSVWNLVQGNVYGGSVSGMDVSCTVFTTVTKEGREIFHGGAFGMEGGLSVTIVLMCGITYLLLFKNENKTKRTAEEL